MLKLLVEGAGEGREKGQKEKEEEGNKGEEREDKAERSGSQRAGCCGVDFPRRVKGRSATL